MSILNGAVKATAEAEVVRGPGKEKAEKEIKS